MQITKIDQETVVYVYDAPGYADFTAVYGWAVTTSEGRRLAILECEDETYVIPVEHVHLSPRERPVTQHRPPGARELSHTDPDLPI